MCDYDPYDSEAYEAGRLARSSGLPESANPYKPSGHERDTTPDDERHQDWWSGWCDGLPS